MEDVTNPTERPEERDSLAEIEERLANVPLCERTVLAPDGPTCRSPIPSERRPIAKWCRICITRHLLAEVKELREENARLLKDNNWQENQLKTAVLHARIKQMEEALREAERRARDVLPTAKSTGSTAMLSFVQYVRDIRKTIARAALSPSDTEEEA